MHVFGYTEYKGVVCNMKGGGGGERGSRERGKGEGERDGVC